MNNMGLVSALFFEPRKAFAAIDARPRFGFALLVVLLASVATVIWYQSVVDIEWATDRTIRASSFAARMTEAQIEEAVQRAADNRTFSLVIAAVFTPIAITALCLLMALYFKVAGGMSGLRRGYRHWLALTTWLAVPTTLLSFIAGAFVLLTTTTAQIDQGELKPLSLNSLLFHRGIGEPGYGLFSNLDLIQFFGLFLTIVAAKVWSGRSWLYSSLFGLVPYALIFGTVAIFSLRQS